MRKGTKEDSKGDIYASYEQLRRTKGLAKDQVQESVVKAFGCFLTSQRARSNPSSPPSKEGLWYRLRKRVLTKKAPKDSLSHGFYLWGPVGRGKTMLMDLFFAHAPLPKRRFHFYAFMQEVHRRIFALRNKKDPPRDLVASVARQFACEAKFLCLDELQVNDITDASILEILIAELLKQGCFFVITSNTRVDELYKGGLARERFLPCIDLMLRKFVFFNLDTPQDYRRLTSLALEQVYFVKNSQDFLSLAHSFFSRESFAPQPLTLKVSGHNLHIKQASQRVCLVRFSDICESALGAEDYLVLAEYFGIIFLEDVPQFYEEKTNALLRFITLVDILYDKHLALIISAEVDINSLCMAPLRSGLFERTASRLFEMQEKRYLERARGMLT